MLDFPPILRRFRERVMAKASHFRGRRDWERAVRLHLIGSDFVFSRPAQERATVCCLVVAWIPATRSVLEIGRSASPLFDLYRSRFAIADLVIVAAGLFAVADSVVPAVVGFVADFAAIADFADSAFVVYPSAAVMVKATAAVAAASCSSGRRSSSLRNRNFPSPLYFAARA